MSTLAHVLEAAGLATVAISSTRPVAEKMHPPRVLHGEFPLGRPLGKPSDTAFQLDVLERAFALLERPEGPVLEDHPEVIEADDVAMACTIPPRFDPDLPPAVDEARGLRKAYDRAVDARGSTSVGRIHDADAIPDALALFGQIADGAAWNEVGLAGGNPMPIVHDIRAYYEEAGLQLVEGPPPGGRATETWFYEETEAGKTIMAARRSMKAAEAPFPVWFYMAPGHRN